MSSPSLILQLLHSLVHGALEPDIYSDADISKQVQTSLCFQFYCLWEENASSSCPVALNLYDVWTSLADVMGNFYINTDTSPLIYEWILWHHPFLVPARCYSGLVDVILHSLTESNIPSNTTHKTTKSLTIQAA